jgi:hypothetical protein
MFKNLKAIGVDVKNLSKSVPALVNPEPGAYGPYSAKRDKLEAAKGLDYSSAVKSSSWGAFQVMGHFRLFQFHEVE